MNKPSKQTSKTNIRRRGDTYTCTRTSPEATAPAARSAAAGFARSPKRKRTASPSSPTSATATTSRPTGSPSHSSCSTSGSPPDAPTSNREHGISMSRRSACTSSPTSAPSRCRSSPPSDLNRLYWRFREGGRQEPTTSRRHPPGTLARMHELKNAGYTAEAIAQQLRADGHASAEGLTRHAVAAILRRQRTAIPDAPSVGTSLSAANRATWCTAFSSPRSATRSDGTASTETSPRPRPHRPERRYATSPARLGRRNISTVSGRSSATTATSTRGRSLPPAAPAEAKCSDFGGTDVDLDRATATIANQLTSDHQHDIVFKDLTKTQNAYMIHLDPATIELLGEWRTRQNTEKEALGDAYRDNGLVFCLEDGRPYHPERFSREFLRKQQQHNATAGPDGQLPRLTIHGLRHTWATIALAEHIPLKTVSDRLNHSTINITAEVYSHVTPRSHERPPTLWAG